MRTTSNRLTFGLLIALTAWSAGAGAANKKKAAAADKADKSDDADDASSDPETADLVPSANFALTGFQASATTERMPSTSAASTAQMAVALPTSVTMGVAPSVNANSWVLP